MTAKRTCRAILTIAKMAALSILIFMPRASWANDSPATLLAARGTVGTNDISTDGLYLFANPVTGFYRIPGNAFVAALDDIAIKIRRTANGYSFIGSAPVAPFQVGMFAEVHLPAFSQVVSLTCQVRDNSNTNALAALFRLKRRVFDSATATDMGLVSAATTPGFQSTEILSESTALISDPLIFNSQSDYFLHVTWTQDSVDPSGNDLRFYGCEIRYLYSILLN